MDKTRVGTTAIVFSCIAILFVFISFFSSSWLVFDGEIENPKFQKLGLWFVCFKNFTDVRHLYDTQFSDCWWVYEEEYYIIHELLLPGFFVATQFFFTLCFLLCLIGSLLMLLYLGTSNHDDRFECLLMLLGSDMLSAACCGTIAILLFGFNGDSRVWMPHWEHNNMGWSFVVAIVGTAGLYIAAILYLVESRRFKIRHRKLKADHHRSRDYDTNGQ